MSAAVFASPGPSSFVHQADEQWELFSLMPSEVLSLRVSQSPFATFEPDLDVNDFFLPFKDVLHPPLFLGSKES